MKLLLSVCLLLLVIASTFVNSLPPRLSSVHPSISFPWADDGIVDPSSYYQRYRRDEYPTDKPFYQWWYYMLSDFTANRFFFISFYIDETVADDHIFTFGAGEINTELGTHWYKAEAFPIDVLTVDNYFDLTVKDPETGEVMYQLQVVDNNTFHIVGTMNHPQNIIEYENIPPNTVIHVNFTLSRLVGWYGEFDFEKASIWTGEVMWNTYAHNSLIEGEVVVGNVTHVYEHTTQFRAYGDMNWGQTFPHGPSIPDDVNYPWGWYTAQVPNEDPTMDFSYAIGAGTIRQNDITGNVIAGFADFRFNNYHLGIRIMEARDNDHFKIPILKTSTDGELLSFTFGRNNYVPYVDNNGYNYTVPLEQWLVINTTHFGIVLNYTTAINQMNRLPMRVNSTIVSNFESLGATVNVVIDYYNDGNLEKNLYNFVTHSGGLECGYITSK